MFYFDTRILLTLTVLNDNDELLCLSGVVTSHKIYNILVLELAHHDELSFGILEILLL